MCVCVCGADMPARVHVPCSASAERKKIAAATHHRILQKTVCEYVQGERTVVPPQHSRIHTCTKTHTCTQMYAHMLVNGKKKNKTKGFCDLKGRRQLELVQLVVQLYTQQLSYFRRCVRALEDTLPDLTDIEALLMVRHKSKTNNNDEGAFCVYVHVCLYLVCECACVFLHSMAIADTRMVNLTDGARGTRT